MSEGLIIAIVVVALILLAVVFLVPRMRKQTEIKKRERELANRRDAVATEHRDVATSREHEAEQAERKARLAQKEAERQRAEAELHQERATMHERGDADHELIDEHERDRFAGTSADPDGTMAEQSRGAEPPRSEFEQGREVGHEETGDARFTRDERPADSPAEPTRRQ